LSSLPGRGRNVPEKYRTKKRLAPAASRFAVSRNSMVRRVRRREDIADTTARPPGNWRPLNGLVAVIGMDLYRTRLPNFAMEPRGMVLGVCRLKRPRLARAVPVLFWPLGPEADNAMAQISLL
jgi:hypothetical protein